MVFWPPPPALPLGAHVWVIGLTPASSCDLVAADHVVPAVRHEVGTTMGQVVERLAPATKLAAGRQYQLRVRSPGRTDIVAVWTVVDPAPAPQILSMAIHDHHPHPVPGLPSHAPSGGAPPRFVELAMTGTAIVQVTAADGGAAIDILTGSGVVAAPRLDATTREVTVRVLAPDGALIEERTLA